MEYVWIVFLTTKIILFEDFSFPWYNCEGFTSWRTVMFYHTSNVSLEYSPSPSSTPKDLVPGPLATSILHLLVVPSASYWSQFPTHSSPARMTACLPRTPKCHCEKVFSLRTLLHEEWTLAIFKQKTVLNEHEVASITPSSSREPLLKLHNQEFLLRGSLMNLQSQKLCFLLKTPLR